MVIQLYQEKFFINKARASVNFVENHSLETLTENSRATSV
jgi:hypothetical protein